MMIKILINTYLVLKLKDFNLILLIISSLSNHKNF